MKRSSTGSMLRVYGLPKEGRADAARFLADLGFTAVTVGADETPESVQPALEAGLQVWRCRAAFTVRHLPDDEAGPLLARDVDGAPQRWFGSGCPNAPRLREAHLEHVRETAFSGAFTGFLLDGIRFASPNAGDGFWTCFCPACERIAAEKGYDFPRMRREVRALRESCRAPGGAPLAPDPAQLVTALAQSSGVADWLRFRAECVGGHVAEVRAAVDEANVRGVRFQLGAYIFAPSLSPLVGQRYDLLAPLLDAVSPMLYRTLGPGDACLATELGALAGMGLVPPPGERAAGDVGLEVQRARNALSGRLLWPILQLHDDAVAETTRAARHAGADGLDYFIFRAGSEAHARAAAAAARDVPSRDR